MTLFGSIRWLVITLLFATFAVMLMGCKEGSGSSAIGLVVGPSELAQGSVEGYSISGLITNNDLTQQLGNVTVSLYNSKSQKVAETFTTGEGKFYFFQQPADFYQIRIDEQSLILASTSYFIRLLPSGTTSPESIEILTQTKILTDESQKVFSVSGVVKNLSQPDTTIPYVLVELFKSDKLIQIQQSSETGSFFFAGLASGTYKLAFARGSESYITRDDIVFEIQANGTVSPPINLIMLEPKGSSSGSYTISGHVKTEYPGIALGNIKIALRREGVLISETSTTADGQFYFFDRIPDFYELQVLPTATLASTTFYVRVLPDGSTSPAELSITLPLLIEPDESKRTYTVAGQVKNSAKPEEVVPYILVELFKSGSIIQVQQTDSGGGFNFSGVSSGSYKLALARGSAQFKTKDDVIFEILSNGVIAPPVNLVFVDPKEIASTTYEITGVIKDLKNDSPLSNIKVTLAREDIALTETSTTTTEGKFFFFDRSPGFYELRIAATAEYASATAYVRILPDGSVSPAQIEIKLAEIVDPDESKRKYRVSGTVKNRAEPAESVPFVLAELYQGTTLLQIQQTDSDGAFKFDDVSPGIYKITFARGSEQFQFRDDVVFEVLTGGIIAPPVTLIFLEPKEISARYSVSGLVALGTTNEPLTGIKVELWKDAISGAALKTTYTTGEGRFTFSGLDSGLYFTRVGADQSVYRVREDYIIQIGTDGVVSPAEALIKLSKDLSEVQAYLDLTGYIRDAFTGAPLEYVTVNLNGYGNVLTDRQGYYFFKDIPAGVYDIELAKLGFSSLSISIQVIEDESTGNLITLPGTLDYYMIYNQETNKGSIAGRAVNPDDGTPFTDKIVRVYKMAELTKEKTLLSALETTYTISETNWEVDTRLLVSTRTGVGSLEYDDAGTFKITHLEPGYYLVYIGEGNSHPVFETYSLLYPGQISWTRENTTANVDRIHSWEPVLVGANTTTYLSTYDTEKR